MDFVREIINWNPPSWECSPSVNNFEKMNQEFGKRKFPLLDQEGWIRAQFCKMALSACGDGVVKAKSGLLFSTTSPKSMN